MRYFTQDQMIN